jgi:2-aminoadipate transaminase
MFDFTKVFAAELPAPSGKWNGLAKYNFTGGNNDAPQIPLDDLVAAASNVLRREGRNLAVYNLGTGPQGYVPLRDFIAGKLKRDAGMSCDRDNILVVSGSLQALDLVNALLLNKGDCVIVEQETYQGTLSRLAQRGVRTIGVPLDNDGMRMDALAATLADLKAKNIKPKFIYTIPTVQNPTATILPQPRRLEMLRLAEEYGVPIVEDDCYADLIWDRQRHLHRVVLEIDRPGAPRRLHRRKLDGAVAAIGAEERRRHGCAGADDPRRVLHQSFRRTRREPDARIEDEARLPHGRAQRILRHVR